MPTDGEIIDRLSYHPANALTAPLHDDIRNAHMELALALNAALPESREKSLALTSIQESMMWSNACVARHGAPVATEEQKAAPQPTHGQGRDAPVARETRSDGDG